MVILPKGSGGSREAPERHLAGPERHHSMPREFARTAEAPERHHRRPREAHRGSQEAPSQVPRGICRPWHPQRPISSTKWALFVDRRQLFPSASTKDTLFVDKSPLPAPNFHKKHLLRGQAVAIFSPHPQKCPYPWTKIPSGHQTSTKSTLYVDRRLHFLLQNSYHNPFPKPFKDSE